MQKPTQRTHTRQIAPVLGAPAAKPSTLTGDFRTHAGFHSSFLDHDRTILVFLPPSYDAEQQRRYPVLYLHDGQNVFDRATSVGEEWGVDETALRLITTGAIQPLLIVGIYNTGEHRIDEYAPTRDEAKGGGGKADRYGRMLIEEIKPMIDREYRTLVDAPNTGIGGSSLGGLLALHLAITQPHVFGKLAALSPSVWWGERAIVRAVQTLPQKRPLRIWLDAGTKEGADAVADARTLRDALVARGWAVGEDLAYSEVEGAEHNEVSWAGRVELVLRFLFPPPAR